MINFTGSYTDKYQLSMAQAYFLKGQRDHSAIFDYFFRKLPFGGGYAIFAGLDTLLEILENLRFDKTDLDYLESQGFNDEFLNYLKNFQFKGSIYSCNEGEVIFPTSPILTVEANIIEAQLIETLVLNVLNFQTLIATKASRIREVSGDRKLIEFGLRRAQGPAGYYASRAAIIGGFDATSNVRAGRDFDIPILGTMAHSFVQSFDDELSAFRVFAESWPQHCVLLVDTYNTLASGVPNAITVGQEMKKQGHQLKGIRIDSGDLAYLSKKARLLLDKAGLNEVEISVSNQLDEYVIKSLLEQDSPIDSFGVGTNLSTGVPDAALDGIYKLAYANNKPRIKISDSFKKITLPYKKQVYRILENGGQFWGADAITLAEEQEIEKMYHPFELSKSISLAHHKKEKLLHQVMAEGKILAPAKTLTELSQYRQQRLGCLPIEYKRIINPHIYKVGLSEKLYSQRALLIEEHKGIK
ncbi:MAG: nicotinate phosphoribosyltransferase [Tatlockia sp.]|nr:nicotinate phosphoribosyltransferase [Tatlockia sp.]